MPRIMLISKKLEIISIISHMIIKCLYRKTYSFIQMSVKYSKQLINQSKLSEYCRKTQTNHIWA